jgi:hypothetical protein
VVGSQTESTTQGTFNVLDKLGFQVGLLEPFAALMFKRILFFGGDKSSYQQVDMSTRTTAAWPTNLDTHKSRHTYFAG